MFVNHVVIFLAGVAQLAAVRLEALVRAETAALDVAFLANGLIAYVRRSELVGTFAIELAAWAG